MPLPRSLANIKHEITEKKWVEAQQWAGGRTSKKKYKMPKSQRPDGTVAGSTKRLASRFYQLMTGHCRMGVPAVGKGSPNSLVLVVPVPNTDEGPPPQGVPEVEGAAEDLVGGGVQEDRKREAAAEGARALRRPEMQSGATGLSHNNRRGKNSAAYGRGSRRRERGVGMGAPGGPERSAGWWRRRWGLGRSRCSYPPHPSWHRRGGLGDGRCFFLSFPLSISLVRNNFSGGPGGGYKGACNEPPRADGGRESRGKMYAAMCQNNGRPEMTDRRRHIRR